MDWLQISLILIGGLGLFLYGMHLMSDGLQKTAGNKLRRWLEKLTQNRIMAVLAGTAITAVIQSSTATTVMTVGFVNAGLMKLSQAVGVVMGANIGTTFSSIMFSFKISIFAPIIAFAGVVIMMVAKKKKTRSIAQVIIGIGILFMGLNLMSDAMSPLKDSTEFVSLIQQAQIPIIGLLAGILLTAVLQSSSAVTGILVAMALAGVLDLRTGVFILFGTNVGTCLTAIIASLGGTKAAKRTAIVHLLFNVIGASIFTIIVLLPFDFVGLLERIIKDDAAKQIAALHMLFSVTTTLVLLPFANGLIWLARKIIRGEDKPREEARLLYIESKSLRNPAVAAGEVWQEVERMANLSLKNYRLAMKSFKEKRVDLIPEIEINEEVINFLENEITKTLVKISIMDLNELDREMIGALYQVVSFVERVGDHAENISEFAEIRVKKELVFSDEAFNEIRLVAENVEENLALALSSFAAGIYNEEVVECIQEAQRDMYAEVTGYRENHLARSTDSISERKVSWIFTSMLEDLRQIVNQAGAIARALEYQNK
ncbi:MAG: Na/Pi cotransporter family protein [Oscillospiraceae bacterium]|nr:Na/Pi cotransporter family protein [Oscillospiraceae bacterium]